MKVIFLDIDGVLWTVQDQMNWQNLREDDHSGREFCRTACRNLNWIMLHVKDAKVVISSTWRLGYSPSEMQAKIRYGGAPLVNVIDSTPVFRGGPRGNEIAHWLKAHLEVTHYVILDDDSDMLEDQKKNFIRTNTVLGLTIFDAAKTVKLLGVDGEEGILKFERDDPYECVR